MGRRWVVLCRCRIYLIFFYKNAIFIKSHNGKWIESIREANKKVTKEEYTKRVEKGWETRRKNLLNKLKDSDNNQENETETTNS